MLAILADLFSQLSIEFLSASFIRCDSDRPGNRIDEDRLHEFFEFFHLFSGDSSSFSVSVVPEEAVENSAERTNQVIVNSFYRLFHFKSHEIN